MLVPAAAEDVAEQPLSAARCVRSEPVAHVHGQDKRHRRLWARQRGQCPPQPSGTDTVQRVVQGTVAAPVFGQKRQVHRRPGRAVGAQQRVRELKQFIAACVQARVDLTLGGPFR